MKDRPSPIEAANAYCRLCGPMHCALFKLSRVFRY
jgi:hypothetical protein